MVSDGAAEYTHAGLAGMVSERRNGASAWYHSDSFSSTRGLTDAAQAVTGSADYDAWGNPVNTAGTLPTPFLHKGGQGYQRDPDSGLLLLGRRYYDPEEGRFLTRDPLGYGGKDLNLYRYANNNPVNASDPSGEVVDTVVDVACLVLDIYDFAQDPSWDGLGLILMDVITAAVPGVPNLGVPSRLMKLGRHAKVKIKYPKARPHLDDVPHCFPAGTLVRMAGGTNKAIERIKPGEEVLTRNEFSGEQGYGKVVRTMKRTAHTLLNISTADGRRVEATPEHPFWVEGKGFVLARRLARSDLLTDEAGRNSPIVRIESRKGRFPVYNFEVVGTHTYYASGWWVHNTCPGSGGGFIGQMEADEARRYAEYWQRNAPKQVEPGTISLDWTRESGRTGRIEDSRVIYDEFGRQRYRIDYTDHMRPTDHTDPHLHIYDWGPNYHPYKETRVDL